MKKSSGRVRYALEIRPTRETRKGRSLLRLSRSQTTTMTRNNDTCKNTACPARSLVTYLSKTTAVVSRILVAKKWDARGKSENVNSAAFRGASVAHNINIHEGDLKSRAARRNARDVRPRRNCERGGGAINGFESVAYRHYDGAFWGKG